MPDFLWAQVVCERTLLTFLPTDAAGHLLHSAVPQLFVCCRCSIHTIRWQCIKCLVSMQCSGMHQRPVPLTCEEF